MRKIVRILLLGMMFGGSIVILHTEAIAGPNAVDFGADGEYHVPSSANAAQGKTDDVVRARTLTSGSGMLTYVVDAGVGLEDPDYRVVNVPVGGGNIVQFENGLKYKIVNDSTTGKTTISCMSGFLGPIQNERANNYKVDISGVPHLEDGQSVVVRNNLSSTDAQKLASGRTGRETVVVSTTASDADAKATVYWPGGISATTEARTQGGTKVRWVETEVAGGTKQTSVYDASNMKGTTTSQSSSTVSSKVQGSQVRQSGEEVNVKMGNGGKVLDAELSNTSRYGEGVNVKMKNGKKVLYAELVNTSRDTNAVVEQKDESGARLTSYLMQIDESSNAYVTGDQKGQHFHIDGHAGEKASDASADVRGPDSSYSYARLTTDGEGSTLKGRLADGDSQKQVRINAAAGDASSVQVRLGDDVEMRGVSSPNGASVDSEITVGNKTYSSKNGIWLDENGNPVGNAVTKLLDAKRKEIASTQLGGENLETPKAVVAVGDEVVVVDDKGVVTDLAKQMQIGQELEKAEKFVDTSTQEALKQIAGEAKAKAPETPANPTPETPANPTPETPANPTPETPQTPTPETPQTPTPEPTPTPTAEDEDLEKRIEKMRAEDEAREKAAQHGREVGAAITKMLDQAQAKIPPKTLQLDEYAAMALGEHPKNKDGRLVYGGDLDKEQYDRMLRETGLKWVEPGAEGAVNIGTEGNPFYVDLGSQNYYKSPEAYESAQAFKKSIEAFGALGKSNNELASALKDYYAKVGGDPKGKGKTDDSRKGKAEADKKVKENIKNLKEAAKAALAAANDTLAKAESRLAVAKTNYETAKTNLGNAESNLRNVLGDRWDAFDAQNGKLSFQKDANGHITGIVDGNNKNVMDWFDENVKSAIDEYNRNLDPYMDAFKEYNEAKGGVERAKEGVKVAEAQEAQANQIDAAKNGVGADLTDIPRMVVEILTPLLAEDDLSLKADLNVKHGDIGEAVGAVDDTALGTDLGDDASSASTTVGAASMVANLLQSVSVDLGLLSEDVTFPEEEAPLQAGSAGGVVGQGSQTGSTPTAKAPPEEEKKEDDTDPLSEKKRQEIERRREELMGQYVAAAIQVAEGMNAISNKFFDRAKILVQFSEGIQTEAAAFGLAQDAGRYVLLETLRGVALSSIQMGVQATRLLNEQVVEVKNENN